MTPRISVIIPVYNCEKYITETVESVLNQTYKNYEIVVIDDGSTDNTAKVLSEFGDKIQYILQNNGGVSAARNKGISIAEGEYIALLDHDDLWMPDKLEKQLRLFEKNPELGIVYSNMYIIDKDKNVLENIFRRVKPHRGNVFRELFIENFIPCLTAVMPKKVLDDVGLFKSDYTIAEEYELFLRISRKYEVDFINTPLAKYRMHDTNLSRNIKLSLKESLVVANRLLSDDSRCAGILGKKIINEKYFSIYFRMAKTCYLEGEVNECRKYLKKAIKIRWNSFFCYVLYFLTFFGKMLINPSIFIRKLTRNILSNT